ncbi:MAG TPA: GAF domain-containing protein [Kofleriaceae bacterium]|nr:GAF domain-containing protein [Kofleriaceae bacterium]
MADRPDGSWDAPTEHDDQHEIDSGEFGAEDPPTVKATESQRARARGDAIANQLASVNRNVVAKPAAPLPAPPMPLPSTTLPPPVVQRAPAKPSTPSDSIVMLDKVSSKAAAEPAPRRGESAAGGIVVVATGGDAERIRKLCHKHGLLVPVIGSLAAVHVAVSIVVVGEPSPPAPERVVHVVRPTVPDDKLVDLLRALVSGRVIVEPPEAVVPINSRVGEAVRRLATLSDRGAIEMTTIEAITAITACDRAHCLFYDPSTSALWSEAKRREGSDDRQAMGGIVGWAALTGQTIYASPAGDDPRWLQEVDDPDGKPQSRVLVQPIIGADRRVHAVLIAIRRWRHADFSDVERNALASFAALAGPALDLAVAASPPPTPRKARSTLPGAAASKSAIVSTPRAASESRPPPVTARSGPEAGPPGSMTRGRDNARSHKPSTQPPPTVELPPPSDEFTSVDDNDRYSSDSILSLPSPPHLPAPIDQPPVPYKTVKPAARKRPRTHSDSQAPKPRGDGDLVDLAVVAIDDDARRVQRLVKKTRFEISTFARLADVPDFYRVLTLGDAWQGDDARIIYAARSSIPDDQLNDLFDALVHDRVVAPAGPLTAPQSIAEARRSQIALAGARKLAVAVDLAAAETITVETMRELLDTDRAYCWIFEPDAGLMWSEARRRVGIEPFRAIAGITGYCARTGKAANVPHASADPRWLAPLDDPDGDPHSQLLVQPVVRNDGRVHGLLVAVRRPRRPGFTDLDVTLAARFAGLVAPLFEQIAVTQTSQELVGEDTSARPPIEPRAQSSVSMMTRVENPIIRWVFLAIGLAVGVIIGVML